MVHPVLLWVDAKRTTVEEDHRFEVLSVSKSTDSSFEGHDFAVHTFGSVVGDVVCAVADNIGETFFGGPGDPLDGFKLGVDQSLK